MVIALGYLAMIGIGLLPLAAFARLAGIEAERTFLLPTPIALLVAFALGLAACLALGHVLGLLRFEHIHSYESRRQAEAEEAARTARSRRMARVRRGRLARY